MILSLDQRRKESTYSSHRLLSLKLKRPSNAVSSLAVIAAYDDDDTSDLDECR